MVAPLNTGWAMSALRNESRTQAPGGAALHERYEQQEGAEAGRDEHHELRDAAAQRVQPASTTTYAHSSACER